MSAPSGTLEACRMDPSLSAYGTAQGGYHMHLGDLRSYLQAEQNVYADGDAWARKAILNTAFCGKFCRVDTIAQYADDIWQAKPLSGAMKGIGAGSTRADDV